MNLESRAHQTLREHHRQLDGSIEIGLCACFFALTEREKRRRELGRLCLTRFFGRESHGARCGRARLGDELFRRLFGARKDRPCRVVRIDDLPRHAPRTGQRF